MLEAKLVEGILVGIVLGVILRQLFIPGFVVWHRRHRGP